MEVNFNNVEYNDIIKNFNFSLKENEVVSIIGKSSSGKTTILDLIYGLKIPTKGSITINNVSIDSESKNKVIKTIRKNISYLDCDQRYKLFNINVLEDIKYGNKKLDLIKLKQLLKEFNLKEDILNKNYMELSKSEVQKTLLISTLLKDSKIILLDNPTLYLDSKSISALIKTIRKIKRNNKIIVICSQDSKFLLQSSDRIIAIYNNKIICDDDKYKVLSNRKILSRINLKQPDVLKFENDVIETKNIKLGYRDNINDLIKDIYRNV